MTRFVFVDVVLPVEVYYGLPGPSLRVVSPLFAAMFEREKPTNKAINLRGIQDLLS